jgi:hypothetical protein
MWGIARGTQRAAFGAFVLFCASGCTDLVFNSGTGVQRVSESHILAGRPPEQGGPELARQFLPRQGGVFVKPDRLVSTDRYLDPLDFMLSETGLPASASFADRLGFSVDIFNLSEARAKGLITRVAANGTRVELDNSNVSPRSGASAVGSVNSLELLQDLQTLCETPDALIPIDEDTCRRLPGLIDDLNDVRSSFNSLRFTLRDITPRWAAPDPAVDPGCTQHRFDDGLRCSPVLALHVEINVDDDQRGFAQNLVSFSWKNLEGDLRIYPTPCTACRRVAHPPVPSITHPPARLGRTANAFRRSTCASVASTSRTTSVSNLKQAQSPVVRS